MRRIAERGFTLIEIMIVVAIIALLAAIAIPNVLRGRTTANESAAIGNARALISGLEMFRSVNNVYPTTWVQMTGATPPFNPAPFAANLVAGATVQGFNYLYTPGAVPVSTYTLTATPQTFNQTGTRAFLTSQNGTIQHCTTSAQGQVPDGVGDVTIDLPAGACP